MNKLSEMAIERIVDLLNNRGRRQLSNFKSFIFDAQKKEKEEIILDKRSVKKESSESESE